MIFLDTDSAQKEYPEIFKQYFDTIIPSADTKYATLNTAVWSGGSFVYVPKGADVDIPRRARDNQPNHQQVGLEGRRQDHLPWPGQGCGWRDRLPNQRQLRRPDIDERSASDTIPFIKVEKQQTTLAYEATVGRIGAEQLFYLMSRGILEADAMSLIVLGFMEPFIRELPIEYAVELNRLSRWRWKARSASSQCESLSFESWVAEQLKSQNVYYGQGG